MAQIAGPHPRRDISEKVAREFEAKLGLAASWLDQEHSGGPHKLNDRALADCVRAVATVLRDEGLRPDPESYATIVQLVYDHTKLTGHLDEAFIKKLTELLRR